MRKKREIISGIYCWEAQCGPRTGIKYVGKAKDLHKRKNDHLQDLRKKQHYNSKLQNYFNKYGEESIKFIILMKCPVDQLKSWEIFFSRCFDSVKNGFGFCEGGGGSITRMTPCVLQNMVTGETVKFDSIQEFCNVYGFSNPDINSLVRKKKKYCEDWINPQNVWRPKIYEVIDPNGNTYQILEPKIHEFYKTHNLNRKLFVPLLKGKIEYYKGWTRPNSNCENIKKRSTFFRFITPDGNIVETSNIHELSKKFNVKPHIFHNLLDNPNRSSMGWRVYNDGDIASPNAQGIYYFVSPGGQKNETDNLAKFAKENNLEKDCLSKLWNGVILTHKQWRKYKDGETYGAFNENEFKDSIRKKQSCRQKNKNEYKFTDANGKLHVTDSLSKISKDFGLNESNLSKLNLGKIKSCKGWTKYKEDSNG